MRQHAREPDKPKPVELEREPETEMEQKADRKTSPVDTLVRNMEALKLTDCWIFPSLPPCAFCLMSAITTLSSFISTPFSKLVMFFVFFFIPLNTFFTS
jgi:hypothetical protein